METKPIKPSWATIDNRTDFINRLNESGYTPELLFTHPLLNDGVGPTCFSVLKMPHHFFEALQLSHIWNIIVLNLDQLDKINDCEDPIPYGQQKRIP